jgi:hypothetical protein
MKTTPIIGQKSGRGERVLWKPDFVLCVIPFDFINLRYSPHFQWFWFSAGVGVLTGNACLRFWIQLELGGKKKTRDFK